MIFANNDSYKRYRSAKRIMSVWPCCAAFYHFQRLVLTGFLCCAAVK